jgi:hypothetical protein
MVNYGKEKADDAIPYAQQGISRLGQAKGTLSGPIAKELLFFVAKRCLPPSRPK